MKAKKNKAKDEKPLSPLSNSPMQIKFPDWQMQEIEAAVEVSGMTKVQIVRLATEAGIEYLKEINFRVGKAAFREARRQREKL